MTPPTRPSGRSKGTFATFGLRKSLLRAISDAGFEEPRSIQAKTIPQVLLGRDVLGLAQTGTGKTAAFALPIIEHLVASRGRNPRALIVAPTRELVLQIHREIELLAKYTDVRATTVFGGVNATPQVRALRKNPDIVVACPGRLLDLASSGHIRFEGIEVLVLDEADHMLDMGFLPDIKRILARLPEKRQNLLFSATMPREIRGLTDRMLRDPHVVELEHAAPLETIEHALYPVDQKRKTALLRHLLDGDDFASAIVFLRTKHRARRLARDLDQAGHRAIALQGNMSQPQRQRAMQGFRDGRYDVLVATDIAARGIDVAQVSHVINFDVPNTPDAYTHRIGRTGRSERSGKAYTFVTHEDFPQVKAIERHLKMAIPRVKLRDFGAASVDEDALDGGRGQRSQASGRAQRSGARPHAGHGRNGRGSGGAQTGGTGTGRRSTGGASQAARRRSTQGAKPVTGRRSSGGGAPASGRGPKAGAKQTWRTRSRGRG